MTQHILRLAALLAALALTSCGGSDEPSTSADGAASGATPDGSQQAGGSAAAMAALRQPDPDKPLSSYRELASGQDLMFMYVAASQMPPDFEDLAETFSPEYRKTIDAFAKSDLMQSIKPQLEQGLAEAAASPYAWVAISDADLEPYDFERQGFTVGEFTRDMSRYFSDTDSYTYQWVNRDQVAFAPVADEELARRLEAMRTSADTMQRVDDLVAHVMAMTQGGPADLPPPNHPHLRVYFFARSADPTNREVNAVVTRVQITDHSGEVLLEYGPDTDSAFQQRAGQP